MDFEHIDMHYSANGDMKIECSSNDAGHSIRAGNNDFFSL